MAAVHASRVADLDEAAWIGQECRRLECRVAHPPVRIDGDPGATRVQHVEVLQVAVQHDHVPGIREEVREEGTRGVHQGDGETRIRCGVDVGSDVAQRRKPGS